MPSWEATRPSSRMIPLLGASSPAIDLSKVDLPQPEGPIKSRFVHALIESERLVKTRFFPNDLWRFSTSRRAGISASDSSPANRAKRRKNTNKTSGKINEAKHRQCALAGAINDAEDPRGKSRGAGRQQN